MQYIISLSSWKKHLLFLLTAILISALVNVLFVETLLIGPVYLLVFFICIPYLILLFRNPSIGFITIVILCFIGGFISAEIIEIPSLTIIDALLLITFIACFYAYSAKNQDLIKNDQVLLLLFWFLFSVLQMANPERPNFYGGLSEIRMTGVYPLLITLIAFMTLKSNRDLRLMLILFLVLSLFACFNGIKQQLFGLSVADQAFLDNGGASTHVLWGRIRYFSFFDAARFGCLMAQLAVITFVLTFGKFKLWKRAVFMILTILFVYGMLISGTRTALIVIVAGAFFAILVSKNYKIFLLGSLFMILFLCFLKYTHIGSGNYEIYRLRSAVNPEDESLNVRYNSQLLLKEYMASRPFGAGLGVIGYNGHKYNSDKFPSTIEPDSFWVKIWVMYGVVGLILWFGMYMYLFGKCFGIIWNIKDDRLRFKLIALASSSFGIFFCSYGNEIINTIPSLLIVAVSLVFIYRGPYLDREIRLTLNTKN